MKTNLPEAMVKVHLISITENQNDGSFDVGILVDANIYTFEITVKTVKIGGKYFQNTSGGQHFWDTLQHHPGVITTIYKFVLKVYNGELVELPVMITQKLAINPLLTRREAVFA